MEVMVVGKCQIIRNARIAKVLTQEELGRIVGVQSTLYFKYKYGQRRIILARIVFFLYSIL